MKQANIPLETTESKNSSLEHTQGNKPEYKLLPCVFCTIGYNCYVASHKALTTTVKYFNGNKTS